MFPLQASGGSSARGDQPIHLRQEISTEGLWEHSVLGLPCLLSTAAQPQWQQNTRDVPHGGPLPPLRSLSLPCRRSFLHWEEVVWLKGSPASSAISCTVVPPIVTFFRLVIMRLALAVQLHALFSAVVLAAPAPEAAPTSSAPAAQSTICGDIVNSCSA